MTVPRRRAPRRYDPLLPYSVMRNSEFLSGHWLEHRLPQEDEWTEWRTDAEQTLTKLLTIWQKQRDRVEKYGTEAALEQAFIQPIIEALGWKQYYQAHLQRREPDYALFETEQRLEAALDAGYATPDFWKQATLVADAKAWHANLDKPKRDGGKREYPPEQIEWYLDRSRRDYGILTNGRLWRLIPRDIGPGRPRFQTYLEVDLPKLLDACGGILTTDPVFDDFLRFYLLFSPRGFETIAERHPLIERAIRGSSEYRVGVGEDLKERVFEALRLCIEGFINFPVNKLMSHAHLALCREQSFILLYRLLFIMYAEDRGLLPYRRNRLYTRNLSLGRIRDDIEDRLNRIAGGRDSAYSNCATGIWDDLLGLFDFIDHGSGRHEIPRYNGGLFDPEQHPFLTDKKLPDRYIAEVIDQLGRARDISGGNGDLLRVDYRDLSIQHLGSIYEGLLELRPRYATVEMVVIRQHRKKIERTIPSSRRALPGFEITDRRYPPDSVYLETDKGERHSSGSYYTPDHVVEYIVKSTLGPLCAEVNRRLTDEVADAEAHAKRARGANRTGYQQRVDKLRVSFDERALQLRVLDPAMGSGHFLVRACQYLAEEIATNPLTNDPEADAIKGDETTLTYWKRRVAESCIYGVDLNPLAVELAKLALWLDTVAVDQPLTFLDHHLRVGNSLIGAAVDDLGVLPDAPPLHRNAFKDQLEQRIPILLQPLFEISHMPSLSAIQVKEKERLYRRVFQPISDAFKGVADLWCSTFFADLVDQVTPAIYQDALDSLNNSKKASRLASTGLFSKATKTARSNEVSCFHWELEFPEVFFDRHGRRSEAGFDAVIGNPPYIRVRVLREFTSESVVEYLQGRYRCAKHVWDIYLLFFEKALDLTASDGRIGFILPIQTLHQPNCASLRTLLLRQTLEVVADLARLRVFEGPVVKNCILVCAKKPPANHRVAVFQPAAIRELFDKPLYSCDQHSINSNPGSSFKVDLLSPKRDLCQKLQSTSWQLSDLCYVTFGLRSCAPGKGHGGKDRLITDNPREGSAKPYLEGREIARYRVPQATARYIRYLPDEMYSPRTPKLFETTKIVSQTMLSRPRIIAGLDVNGYYVEQSLLCIVPHGIITDREPVAQLPLEFILALVNSRLQSFYFRSQIIDYSLGGGLIHATPGSQSKLIIPKGPAGIDSLVSAVAMMLELQHRLTADKPSTDNADVQRQIDATDRLIDQLVYELYGLTADEIRIVEEATDASVKS